MKTYPKAQRTRQGPQAPAVIYHIIGGGPAGLMAAITLARMLITWMLGRPFKIIVYEASAFGGGTDDHGAAPHSQLWQHSGALYATSQPWVTLGVQRSVSELMRLAPHAFTPTLALLIALQESGQPMLAEVLAALGLQHWPVPLATVHTWLPLLRLPSASQVCRVLDGQINLPLLSHALMTEASGLGGTFVRRRVTGLKVTGDTITELIIEGERCLVREGDQVILACGSGIRPLLSQCDIHLPGLRHFQSHLVATPAFGIPVLLAVDRGGPTIVPQRMHSRLINVCGNSQRTELPPETDGDPLMIDHTAVEGICQEVEEWFGLRIPQANRFAWAGVKTEMAPDGARAQAHYTGCVPGLANIYLLVPGKLSQVAVACQDLAGQLLQQQLGDSVARPVWEGAELKERSAGR